MRAQPRRLHRQRAGAGGCSPPPRQAPGRGCRRRCRGLARRAGHGRRPGRRAACSTAARGRRAGPDAGACRRRWSTWSWPGCGRPTPRGAAALSALRPALACCRRRSSTRRGWPPRCGVAGPLLVKRDDLTGFARRRQQGPASSSCCSPTRGPAAPTCWSPAATSGSNFVQAAAAAAAWAGLRCVLVLAGPPVRAARTRTWPPRARWGAEVRFTGDPDRDAASTARSPSSRPELAAGGPSPVRGARAAGRAPVGAPGYRHAVDELLAQLDGQPTPVVVRRDRLRRHARRPRRRAGRRRPAAARVGAVGEPAARRGRRRRCSTSPARCADAAGEPRPGGRDVEVRRRPRPGHGIASPEGDGRAARAAHRRTGARPRRTRRRRWRAPARRSPPRRPALFWHTGGLLDAVAALAASRAGRPAPRGTAMTTGPGWARRWTARPRSWSTSGFAPGERRRPAAARRAQPGRPGARARPARARHRSPAAPAGGSLRRCCWRPSHRARGLPATTRPSASRTTRRERLLHRPDRRRRRLAARRAGPAARPSRIALRLHLRGQLADLIGGGRRRSPTALADRPRGHSRTWMPDQTYLQHAQPSTFGHYLLSLRLPGAARRAAPVDALARINTSPGGRRLRQRQPAARRPRAGRRAARLRRRHRAHPRRDVADRRAHRTCSRRRPAWSPPRASSPRTWRSGRAAEFDYVDLADGVQPLERAHAAEAQPVRAVDRPRGVRHADRPAHRLPRRGQEPVGAQRQPDLRLRRDAPGARPRPALDPAHRRRRRGR